MRRQRRFSVASVESLEDRVALAGAGPASVHPATPPAVGSRAPAIVGPTTPSLATPALSTRSAAQPSPNPVTTLGQGGAPFVEYQPYNGLMEVWVRSGSWIDSIQLLWYDPHTGGTVAGPRHGGDGGTLQELALVPREEITKISVATGLFVDYLEIQTSRGQFFEAGHVRPGDTWEDYLFSDTKPPFAGIQGRSGAYLDSLVPLAAGQ